MIGDKPTQKWLAVYLYYNEPWEQFLTEAIMPYVNTVIKTGIAEQYFFIRYWNRGPHIRLRFKGDRIVLDSILRPNIEEHFQNYYESKPSTRKEPNYPPRFPRDYKWFPNNSLQFISYEQEVARYAGKRGMEIAEHQFSASSDVVLECMKQKIDSWDYDLGLGEAIKLHLSFIYAMKLNLEQATSFFKHFFHHWLPRSFSHHHRKLTSYERKRLSQETIDAFNVAFEKQKEQLIPYHTAIWEGLQDAGEFEEPYMNQWLKENKKIKLQLDAALMLQKLRKRPPNLRLKSEGYLSPEVKLMWGLYADFIHMTNNRLGILNRDEGFLGYLMMQSLSEMSSFKTINS